MIISDTHKFIFIHNPKCAGSSIRAALMKFDTRSNFYSRFGRDYVNEEMDAYDKKAGVVHVIDKAHIPLARLRTKYPEDYALLQDYLTFTMCRHPLSRLLSAFEEYTRNFHPTPSLLEPIDHLERYIDGRMKASATEIRFIHSLPQYIFFSEGSKIRADIIIHLENPTPGIKMLRALASEPADILQDALAGDRKNASRPTKEKGRLWHGLSDLTKRKVIDYYEKDFVLLGYSTEFPQ